MMYQMSDDDKSLLEKDTKDTEVHKDIHVCNTPLR